MQAVIGQHYINYIVPAVAVVAVAIVSNSTQPVTCLVYQHHPGPSQFIMTAHARNFCAKQVQVHRGALSLAPDLRGGFHSY